MAVQPEPTHAKPTRSLLRLRARRVAGSTRTTEHELSAMCPLESRPVHIDQCTSCEYCDGLLLGPAAAESFVRCEAPTSREDLEEDHEPFVSTHVGAESDASRVPVSRIMTSAVITVTPDTSVETVTALLLERGISGVPVVDSRGRAIGMISQTDLIREQFDAGENAEIEPLRVRQSQGHAFDLGSGYHAERVARATVGEIMAPLVLALPETASIAHASALLAFEEVHRVPVVRADGTVAGILSTLDVLWWLAEAEGYKMPARNRAGRTRAAPRPETGSALDQRPR